MKELIFGVCFSIISSISSLGQINFNFIKDEHDFGIAEEGAELIYSFEFTNSGKDTIHLTEENRDVRPGCSCTASEYTKEAIPPGGNGFIRAGYNTQGRIGNFNKTITVSQKGTPYKILTIKGVILKKKENTATDAISKKTPILNINKKEYNFGKIDKNKNINGLLTVKNIGKDTLKIISHYSACQCINFRLLNPKDNTEWKNIPVGKTAFLEITYKPATPNNLSDSKTNDIITLFTNDPKNSKIELYLQAEIKNSIK